MFRASCDQIVGITGVDKIERVTAFYLDCVICEVNGRISSRCHAVQPGWRRFALKLPGQCLHGPVSAFQTSRVMVHSTDIIILYNSSLLASQK